MSPSLSHSGGKRPPSHSHETPGITSLLTALKECTLTRNIRLGSHLHSQASATGLSQDKFVVTALINMYSKCGSMAEAQSVFDQFPSPHDVVAWTSLISGYADNGRSALALQTFQLMEDRGCAPNARTFVVALSACSALARGEDSRRWFDRGKEIHSRVSECRDLYVENALVGMYSKFGCMVDGRRVFDRMSHPDIVSWNTLLQGYVENGEEEVALELFEEMKRQGSCEPNSRTYVAAISACASLTKKRRSERLRWLERGKAIHTEAEKVANCSNIFVENTVIDLYSKSGSMAEARFVFERMKSRDVVSWTALIQGYVENGESLTALELFDQMSTRSGVSPNGRLYAVALSACASLLERFKPEMTEKAERIHSQALRNCSCDHVVENTLIDFHAKSGDMNSAKELFDRMSLPDIVSWSTLLQGYVDSGQPELALQTFFSRPEYVPNDRTLIAVLSACASLAARERESGNSSRLSRCLQIAKAVHSQALNTGSVNLFVENRLVDLYSKSGCMQHAQAVFDGMAEHTVVSWTALITGYVENGRNELAVELLNSTAVPRTTPTYVAALTACGNLMDVSKGRELHGEICRRGMETEVVVGNSLVDFYGKCGCTELARRVFESLAVRTAVSWTALMCGYCLSGESERVFELLGGMEEERVTPTEATLVCVLNACSHAGVAERWKEVLSGRLATRRQYGCVVDLLGRGGWLEEAKTVVREMPFEANKVIWSSVLGACSRVNNLEMGSLAYKALMELDERNSGAYVLMAGVYHH